MVLCGIEQVKTFAKLVNGTGSSIGNFQRENGTTFSEVPLFPEIYQLNKPKNHVSFTLRPEFPESLGKWKTPKKTENAQKTNLKNEEL